MVAERLVNMHSIKIGFLTHERDNHIGSWTGTAFHMRDALLKIFPNLHTIGLKRPDLKHWRIINSISNGLFKRTYNLAHSLRFAEEYSLQIENHLKNHSYDVLLAPAFSTSISRLKTNIPIIYISDTTFKLFYGYYDWFSNFWQSSVRQSDMTEALAIKNSSSLVFASKWAAESAINDYHAEKEKVHIIPFGANLNNIPEKVKVLDRPQGNHCKLLFIGSEWKRKGGDLVIDTFNTLEKNGVSCQLTLIGSAPPRRISNPAIKIIPFIDKNLQSDRELLFRILLDHHLLFVPSRAECFGIVFSEASAFGMPSITTDTGGIPSAVHEGVNGHLHSLSDGPEQYARTISNIYQNFKERYLPLSLSSREFYESRLNWDQWAASMKPLIVAAAQ